MIAIVDYEAGNLTSVARAIAHLGFPCTVTHDAGEIRRAERVVFPGVGAAGAAMASLRRAGLDRVLAEVHAAGTPMMGICLGCQVILDSSAENDAACLGILPGRVRRFRPAGEEGGVPKIPHMGWNRIAPQRPHPLLAGIGPEDEFYFVHSYYPVPDDPACVLAVTEYGVAFASVIGRGNLAATQFHLEKSGRPGLRMLHNFCTWTPGG